MQKKIGGLDWEKDAQETWATAGFSPSGQWLRHWVVGGNISKKI
ncbi:hypothetical protein ACFL35_12720 [Candidatus Riflebacteria bacterium]